LSTRVPRSRYRERDPQDANMSAMTTNATNEETIRIGLLAVEPVRVAGMASIFEQPDEAERTQLLPVVGTLEELLANETLEYIVVDLHSPLGGLEALETIRRARPTVRSIVIGPEGDDELVLSAIIAGARAYLGHLAGPEVVRQAIEVVTSGSIWAPRKLLCRVIDRLLDVPNQPHTAANTTLTQREKQVLELILGAHSTREIASELGIEQRTVKAYIGRLMRKTGADNRVKLSMSALNRSLLDKGQEKRTEGEPGKNATS